MAKKNAKALTGAARLAQELIDVRAKLYRELGDPLQAWEAYWLAWNASEAGVEMPAWVTGYLARVARRMAERSIAISKGRKPAGTLEQALELDGHGAGAVSAKRTVLWRQQQYVVDVIEVMAKGYGQSKAVSALLDAYSSSDRAKDQRTIERAVSEYKRKGWRGAIPPWPSEAARHIRGSNMP